MESSLPRLIVVTGRPASGKTTLAHLLGRSTRCPVLCRDEFKEGYLNTTGEADQTDNGVAMSVYEAFFETIRLLLRHRITLIAEAAFQHRVWEPQLTPLREIADLRIVLCDIDAGLAYQRFEERHSADPLRQQFHSALINRDYPYDPPHLDVPMLVVDTSSGYRPEIEAILCFIQR